MNEPTHDIAARDDDWLEQALAASAQGHREHYIADDGFTARVAAALPRPVTLPAWRKPVVALLWGVTAVSVAAALPGAVTDALREIVKLAGSVPLTGSGIGVGVIALGVATWTAVAVALRNE